nr:unnamed protein product [Spirometra erinaceieuropaei]
MVAWNVRSLLENPRRSQLKRKTGTVIREEAGHDVDIAAPSQTHFSEQIQLKHVSASHTLLRSGHPKAERRNIGVVFVIWNVIVGRLLCLPQCINDCPFGELKSPTSSVPASPQRLALTGLLFSAMLRHVCCDVLPVIIIVYRTDDQLLYTRNEQTPPNDWASNTATEPDVQRDVDRFVADCAHFGLTIDMGKTSPPRPAPHLPATTMATTTTTSSTPAIDENTSNIRQPVPSPLLPPMQPRTHHGLVAIAPSHPTSIFSVNYESIAQRLTNWCSDHRNTPVVIASTLRIKPAPSATT